VESSYPEIHTWLEDLSRWCLKETHAPVARVTDCFNAECYGNIPAWPETIKQLCYDFETATNVELCPCASSRVFIRPFNFHVRWVGAGIAEVGLAVVTVGDFVAQRVFGDEDFLNVCGALAGEEQVGVGL
jgi:hypothetical protein